jgi:hypothetical protein
LKIGFNALIFLLYDGENLGGALFGWNTYAKARVILELKSQK